MFLITAQFRQTRSKRDSGKPGVVFFRITGKADSSGRRVGRVVNSTIRSADSSVLQTERVLILSQLRLLYCVIECREDSGRPFTIDDVCVDFRKALKGDDLMAGVITRSKTDFPLRSDIVSVGREFKDDFKFVLTERSVSDRKNLYDYIFSQSQTLKNDRRISQARNFISLLSNLRLFANEKNICFNEIDAGLIRRYADWLTHTGISDSTQSFYLRGLRSVLNKASADGLIGSTSGWFNDVNTSIGSPAINPDGNINRNLVLKIENLDLTGNDQATLVRDMFMFGFYCGGMELIDIANLTYSNIKGRILIYRRRLKGHEKKVALGKKAMQIIEQYKKTSDRYLFPLLSAADNILFLTVRNYVNQSIKVIGNAVDYPKLTFNMNIAAYNNIISEADLPELLLKTRS